MHAQKTKLHWNEEKKENTEFFCMKTKHNPYFKNNFFFAKQGFGKPYQICSKKVVASNKIKFCQTLLQNKTLFAKTKHKLPKDFPKNKTLF
jgi:hypothetical protein